MNTKGLTKAQIDAMKTQTWKERAIAEIKAAIAQAKSGVYLF